MLAIQKKRSKTEQNCHPNVLPCHIHHNGAVDASTRYWNPDRSGNSDGSETSHFRGRRLKGLPMKVPDGYQGIILEKTETVYQNPKELELAGDKEDEDNAQTTECHVMEEIGCFDEIVVWAHEALPNQEEDPYLKAFNQWVNIADAIHKYDEQVTPIQKTSTG